MVVIGYHAEHCTHNHIQHTQRHHGGHNGKAVVARLLLCTGVYYVVARRVIALNEVWTSTRPRGVHVFSTRKRLLRFLILCSWVRMVSEDDRNEKHRSHTRRHARPRARSSVGTPTCVVTYRRKKAKHSYVPCMNTKNMREGDMCVSLHSQTCINIMIHPSGIWPPCCTMTEMPQGSDTVPPDGRSRFI